MNPLDCEHQVILLLAANFDAAACLNDRQIPPGNRLEPLRGNRHGQHSIRTNAIVKGRRAITGAPAGIPSGVIA